MFKKKQEAASRSALFDNNNEGGLSDAGVFAYCSLCAAALAQLYPEHWHSEFREKLLAEIIRDRPESTRNTALAILHDDSDQSMLPYAEMLLEEESVKRQPEIVLQDVLLVALREGAYDARARYLLKHIAFVMRISWSSLEEWELKTVALLQAPASEAEVQDEAKQRSGRRRLNRFLLIGAAAVGGGTLIGLTGGLAAPLVAAGAGAFIGGGAAAIGTVAGAAVLGSVFGVAGAGLTGWKMRKRVGSISQFEFVTLSPPPTPQLHLAIAVSGWIQDNELDFLLPWQSLAASQEQYALKWESRYLKEMGQALDYFMSFVKGFAIQETLKMTVLSGLLSAVAWPAAMLSASNVIDNPWSVCGNRAEEAGKVLADLLVSREYGSRPVTLVGFSMGARLIYCCLKELASRKKAVEGIVEDVYLLGAPVSGAAKDWEPLGRVVSGKIVNCYCRSDWFLKFMYRTMSASYSLAGLAPVAWADRRMCNLDLTSVISGHKDYFRRMRELLPMLGVRTLDEPRPILSLLAASSSPLLSSSAGGGGSATSSATPGASSAGGAGPGQKLKRSASASELDSLRRQVEAAALKQRAPVAPGEAPPATEASASASSATPAEPDGLKSSQSVEALSPAP